MIKPKQELSIVRQCKLLDIHRSGVYHRPRPSSPINLALMREIDEIHLNRPFLGVRRVTDELCEKGHEINHKRIHRLMQIMGIEAIYPKPNTSKSNPAHKIYPYLLRNLEINRPNQVWATDITFIWIASSVWMHSKKRFTDTEGPKYSTVTKDHSLPVRHSPVF